MDAGRVEPRARRPPGALVRVLAEVRGAVEQALPHPPPAGGPPAAEVAGVRHARDAQETRRTVLGAEGRARRALALDVHLPPVAAADAEVVPFEPPGREVDEVRVAHAGAVVLAPDAEAEALLAGADAGPDEDHGPRLPPEREQLRAPGGVAGLREALRVRQVEERLLPVAQERDGRALAGEHQLHGGRGAAQRGQGDGEKRPHGWSVLARGFYSSAVAMPTAKSVGLSVAASSVASASPASVIVALSAKVAVSARLSLQRRA